MSTRRSAKEISNRILHVAQTLFSTYGADEVSMHQIAKAANIGQGTLYRRYENKSALMMDLMEERFNQFQAEVKDYIDRSAQLPICDCVEHVIRKLIHLMDRNSEWLAAMQFGGRCIRSRLDFYRSEPYLFLQGVICGLLKRAEERGEIVPVQSEFTSHLLICSFTPDVYDHLKYNCHYSSEEIFQHFKACFLDPMFRASV